MLKFKIISYIHAHWNNAKFRDSNYLMTSFWHHWQVYCAVQITMQNQYILEFYNGISIYCTHNVFEDILTNLIYNARYIYCCV